MAANLPALVAVLWGEAKGAHAKGCRCTSWTKYDDPPCLALRARLKAALVAMVEAWHAHSGCGKVADREFHRRFCETERAAALKALE